MTLLAYLGIWFVVSCATAPFIGAFLGRSLEEQSEYPASKRIRDTSRAPAKYRLADRMPAGTPVYAPVPSNRAAAFDIAHRASHRSR